jgi:beta-lactamase class D
MRLIHRLVAAIFLIQIATACTPSKSADQIAAPSDVPLVTEVDLSNFFAGINPADATFVVYHPSSNQLIRYNTTRAQQRFIPASTYKIPNSLIALETGVAEDAEHLIPWHPALKPETGFWSPDWSKDQTLRSAIRGSVYWYYQALARDIGTDRMQSYVDLFDYGNRDTSGGIDTFWLDGSLKISADEQVRFLEKMYNGKLGISSTSTQILKDILLLENTDSYRLSGKTGTVDLTPTRELAWLVGFIEREGDVWFYALNMDGEQVWEQWGSSKNRLALVRQLLQELAIIPATTAAVSEATP